MKNHRNQIQNKREPSSHYVIQSERYLGWLFAFFSVCNTGLLIYSIIIEEALWAILILLFISLAMIIAAFNIGLWKVEVNDKEITYRSTFGCVRKYHFENITKGVYKKSGAFRVYIGAVSYTHLSCSLCRYRSRPVWDCMGSTDPEPMDRPQPFTRENYERQTAGADHRMDPFLSAEKASGRRPVELWGSGAVSYTHLDVYKRQT